MGCAPLWKRPSIRPVSYTHLLVGDRTYAELSDEEKDAVSHRGKAMRLFAERLKTYLDGHPAAAVD